MSANANNRASLLAGLRTGGVRSSSGPTMVPHTAAPGGTFNVSRFPSQQYAMDDDEDELADLVQQNLHFNGGHRSMMQHPATASAADGAMNKFQQQQQTALLRQMAAQRAAMNGMGGMQGMNGMSVDPLQMQVVQMEIMKLQALQQAQQMQQYQAELLHQAQVQQAQQQAQNRPGRRLSSFQEPATAGPTATSFDLRSAHANGHDENQMPMTAAIGGRFANRPPPLPLGNGGLNPHANVFQMRNGDSLDELPKTPKTPTRTTVISGGTALGTGQPTAATLAPAQANAVVTSNIAPSKSDSAISWRRGGAPVNGAPRTMSGQPAVLVTPPDESYEKMRPPALRFTNGNGVPTIAIDDGGSDGEGSNSSQPSTPPSAGSFNAREEAAKKLYEGLGIGRPAPLPTPAQMVKNTQVIRQPRGPPGATEELMARNFATRVRGVVIAVEA